MIELAHGDIIKTASDVFFTSINDMIELAHDDIIKTASDVFLLALMMSC